jgi:hypothetical protein
LRDQLAEAQAKNDIMLECLSLYNINDVIFNLRGFNMFEVDKTKREAAVSLYRELIEVQKVKQKEHDDMRAADPEPPF